MNDETTPETTPGYTVLAEASYDAHHLLLVRHYPIDDGLFIGCGAAGNPVLAKAPAWNLRAIIQAMNQGMEAHFDVPMGEGFNVHFHTHENGNILVLSLHDSPDQSRMGVMLDAALTMMALGDGGEGGAG